MHPRVQVHTAMFEGVCHLQFWTQFNGLLSSTCLSTPECLQMLMQGLLSNAMVSKLLLKYMQGKAGLRTKMVLQRSGMKVYIPNSCACLMQQRVLVMANFKKQDHNMLCFAF